MNLYDQDTNLFPYKCKEHCFRVMTEQVYFIFKNITFKKIDKSDKQRNKRRLSAKQRRIEGNYPTLDETSFKNRKIRQKVNID